MSLACRARLGFYTHEMPVLAERCEYGAYVIMARVSSSSVHQTFNVKCGRLRKTRNLILQTSVSDGVVTVRRGDEDTPPGYIPETRLYRQNIGLGDSRFSCGRALWLPRPCQCPLCSEVLACQLSL